MAVIFYFRFWPQKVKKFPKEPEEAIMKAINFTFWTEIKITLIFGILYFIISK